MSVGSVHHYLTCGLPLGTGALVALRGRLQPYREALFTLAALDTRLDQARAELAALADWDSYDPHTPYRRWRERLGMAYDAALWRERGKLYPARTGKRTVDYLTVLDGVASEHGEDVPAFVEGIEAAAARRDRIDALRADIAVLDSQWAGARASLRARLAPCGPAGVE